ncbi:MAG: hypothetical protein LBC84_09895 [Prevotellaceae bacterium]|jgi:hypothetical protein|nr:hypothetical protein [Prevotellaceae bacterium]
MQHIHKIEHTHLRSNPYGVPQGYFDLLPQQIGQIITQVSASGGQEVGSGSSLRMRLRAQLALAASFVLLIGLGYGIVWLVTPEKVDRDPFNSSSISLFNTYTLLQDDEWEDPIDLEQIITFLTDRGISPNAIAYLDD